MQKIKVDKKTYKIGYRQIQEELKSTLISEVWGVGKNTTALLKKHLIQSAWDFVSQDDVWIKKNLGKIGLDLKQELLGNIVNPVQIISSAPKSVSRSESFKEFQTNKNYIQEQLNMHIHRVCKKLRNENLLTGCIMVMLRTKDFQVFDMKINLISPTNTEFKLINHSKEILDKLYQKGIIYRSVGFSAMKLTAAKTQQISLFDGDDNLKKQELSKSWDKLEEKYGRGIVTLGAKKEKEKSKK